MSAIDFILGYSISDKQQHQYLKLLKVREQDVNTKSNFPIFTSCCKRN